MVRELCVWVMKHHAQITETIMNFKLNKQTIFASTALLLVAATSNASDTINPEQSLISDGNVLTSQFYVNNFDASIAESNTRLKSAVVTNRNVLTSNYLISMLPESNAQALPIPDFEDEIDATVTDQNILSSKYRAAFSSQGE